MDFNTEAQRICYERVAAMLQELFGEFVVARTDCPRFLLMVGSAVTEVVVGPWDEEDAVITATSCVVAGAELTPDLLQYLLEQNRAVRFGAFGLGAEGEVIFEYNIMGSTFSKSELKAGVMAVAITADQYDDEIIARWGGDRAVDRQEVGEDGEGLGLQNN